MIHTLPCPDCYLCGRQGTLLYCGLKDRLFGIFGEWNLKKCPDPKCGLIWLDPMPQEKDIIMAYQNYYTHEFFLPPNTYITRLYFLIKEGYLAYKYGYYNELSSTGKKLMGMLIYLHPGLRANMDFSIMYLPAKPNGTLLEIGSGSGKMLKLMQDLGWQVEGVDFDPIAVKNAQAKGFKVRLGTLEAQGYPSNHFDAIIMSHLIEHVYEPLQLLSECYRILKPRGDLVIVTPNSESWGHKLYKKSWMPLDPPRHLHIFALQSLQGLIKKVGFSNLSVSTTIRDVNNLFLGCRSIQRTGKYVMGSYYPWSACIWARCMQFLEWMFIKINPNIGEEIALIAKK